MSVRLWRSFGLAILVACVTAIAVSAKSGYSFITIAGADLKEPIRTSDLTLTEDFFAFADFYRDRVEAPVDPGTGYEITRYFIDGTREIAFDRLHYYPATGFVYYDGIVNGSSEYDGEWYSARPEIASVFEGVLASATTTTNPVTESNKPNIALDPANSLLPIGIVAGLAVTILILISRRRIPTQ